MSVRSILFAASTALILSPIAADAQDYVLSPDEEVVVREYVVRQRPREIVLPDDYDPIIGEELPDMIEVSPIDAPDIERSYEYVVVDGQILLIDPASRRIVQVLDE